MTQPVGRIAETLVPRVDASSRNLLDFPDEILLPIVQLMPIEDVGALACVNTKFRGICNDYSLWSRFARDHDFSIGEIKLNQGPVTVGDLQVARQKQIPGMVIAAVKERIESMPDGEIKTRLTSRLQAP
ncbi:MAG: hypothetical protein KR126chlam1_01521, partial [Chlamydiae bacterium]|nr:hypothetical protein [Chlamydiota bacterium]